MLIRRLISVIGAILIIIGVLLITTGFPTFITGPLLIAAGLILELLSAFTGRR